MKPPARLGLNFAEHSQLDRDLSLVGGTMSTAPPVTPLTHAKLDQLCINTIRTLSIDAVQQAKSGHPGTPMCFQRPGMRTMRFAGHAVALCQDRPLVSDVLRPANSSN